MSDESGRVPFNRIERVLTAMIVGIGGISIIAMIVVLIATSTGVTDFSGGIWSFLRILPVIGLPIVLLLIVAFSIIFTVRRRGTSSDGGR